MNRFRYDFIRRANGVIFQQFFSNEAATNLREPPARPLPMPRPDRSEYKKLEDPAETIRNISMNPVNIMNTMMHDNENEYIYKYIHKKLEEHFKPLEVTNLSVYRHVQELLFLLERKHNQQRVSQLSGTIRYKVQVMDLDQLEMLLTALRGAPNREEVRQIARNVDLRLNTIAMGANYTRLSEDLDRWLYLADLLYEQRIKSALNQTLTHILVRDPNENGLTNRQILHLLFLIILERQSNYLLPKYERRILNMLSEASIEDLSIVCLAYFKTRTFIKHKSMLDKIVKQTTENLATIDPKEPGYCSIVKSVRYSRDPNSRGEVIRMISTLLEDPNHSIMFGSPYNAVHTVKLMEAYRIYEPRMLHILRALIFRDLSSFRIKDIQYALTSLSNLTYMDLNPDEGLRGDFDKLVEEIIGHSRADVAHQNYHLIPIIRALAIFNYHNPKLLSHAAQLLADNRQFEGMRGVLEFSKSTLLVHSAYGIQCGDTSLLKARQAMDRCMSEIVRSGNSGSVVRDEKKLEGRPTISHLDNFLRNLKRRQQPNSALFLKIAESLVEHERLKDESFNFNFQFTFPHQNYADLVITKDGPEPGSFDPETLLPKPVPANIKPCIVYAIQKTDLIDGVSRLCGYKQLLIRLMDRLGYHVLPVDLHQPDIDDLARKVEMFMSN